jgi:2-alkyl-3-oxoalkanoate reductase
LVLCFAALYGPDSAQTHDLIAFDCKGWAPIPGHADAFFCSMAHDDAATAVIAALGVRTGVYNIVDDEPLCRQEFLGSLATALGVARPRLPPAWLTPLYGS